MSSRLICEFLFPVTVCRPVTSQPPVCMWVRAQSCPTLCDRLDCSPPVSSVHGVSQARIVKWVAISISRGSSRPRGRQPGSPEGFVRLGQWLTVQIARPHWTSVSQTSRCESLRVSGLKGSPGDSHALSNVRSCAMHVSKNMQKSL